MSTVSEHAPYSTALDDLLARYRERIDREWSERIARHVERLQSLLDRFALDAETAEAEEVEADEYAAVFAGFDELLRLGVRFDHVFVARMEYLRDEAIAANPDSEDEHDTDADDDNEGINNC